MSESNAFLPLDDDEIEPWRALGFAEMDTFTMEGATFGRILATIDELQSDLKSATASYRTALDHLCYITTNREWGKSIRYPELDEFLERIPCLKR